MNLKQTLLTTTAATILSLPAQAIININIYESGDDVVAVGSGSANLTALSYVREDELSGHYAGKFQEIVVGTNGQTCDQYQTINIPRLDYFPFYPIKFGNGAGQSTSGTGDTFGTIGSALYVPDNYVSGTPLSGSSIYENATLDSLDLYEDTYTWTWGSGANADSLVLTISQSPIPEPETYAALFGCAMLGLVLWKRKHAYDLVFIAS